jgi:hypothetical protein
MQAQAVKLTVGGGGANGHGGHVDPDADARVVVGSPIPTSNMCTSGRSLVSRDVLVRNVVRLPHQLKPAASRSTDLSPAASYRELARAPPPKLCLPVPVPGKKKKESELASREMDVELEPEPNQKPPYYS